MPLIFQYGSNTDVERLRARLGDIEDHGRAVTVGEYEIAFNKWSRDKCAAADLIKPRKGGRRIWGVLYEVSKAGFQKLKEIEGPSYRPQSITVEDPTGSTKTVKTFRVRRNKRRTGLDTTGEYVGHIVKGLRHHAVPEEYIQHVIKLAIRTNELAEDQEAACIQNALIERLRHP